ncbi:hypothetical protein ACIRVF_30285 [Kitasatospora sp. NPDC101157]|uniref:hypothetical protein n=1 Tax=Kitasatospora sp. NPDC101157 TaxID=3364098 RepID=UPI0038248EE5
MVEYDPSGGARSDAPSPESAYAAALGPAAENTAVTRLQTALRHSGQYPRASLEREFRLRRAALADRLALESGEECDAAEAARTAYELVAFDLSDGRFVLGPAGPSSSRWEDSARPYVRQEYERWAELTDGGRDARLRDTGGS